MGMFTNLFYKNRNPYISKTRFYKLELEFDSQNTNTYKMTLNSSDISEAEGPSAVKSMVVNFNSIDAVDFCKKYGNPVGVYTEPIEFWDAPSNASNVSLGNGTFAVNTSGNHCFQWSGPSNYFTCVKKFNLFIECIK